MEMFSTLLTLSTGNTVDSFHKGPALQSFDVFIVDNLHKLLNKQSICWWFNISVVQLPISRN